MMLDGDVIVFVEVKVRRGDRQAQLKSRLPGRRRQLLATGEWYIAEHSAIR